MPRSIGILETFAVEKVSIFIPVDQQTISEILHDSQTCGSILIARKVQNPLDHYSLIQDWDVNNKGRAVCQKDKMNLFLEVFGELEK